MTTISLLLACTLILFVWGKWRYDVVAISALAATCWLGIISPSTAFDGFGHPAVVTVTFVLIVGRGLSNSGLIDQIGELVSKVGGGPTFQMASLTMLITIISGFMNNIGALAILMPVGLKICQEKKISPSLMMMPLAFGSLLGGMTTLIGTPPNIIISSYRSSTQGQPFAMFDFLPVGLSIAIGGVLFIASIGYRLVPLRKNQTAGGELFEIENYMTEIKILKDSPALNLRIGELEDLCSFDLAILSLIREGKRTRASRFEALKAQDILIIEGDSEALQEFIEKSGGEIVPEGDIPKEHLAVGELVLSEAVVPPSAFCIGKKASHLGLRKRFGINILAIARQGSRIKRRFQDIALQAGDVLLLQGAHDDSLDGMAALGLLPLADRNVSFRKKRMLLALFSLIAAVTIAAMGWMPIHISFATLSVLFVLGGLLSLKEIYDSIDWPIIVLLGAMIPLGKAFETSGAPDLLATWIVKFSHGLNPVYALALILVGTMFLSDVINNAAAAILMAPLAHKVALGLNVSSDPFLMSVCIGASCAFLTPVGHQCNALVMGPGGYRFGDYWKLGLPLEIIIVTLSIPLITVIWPL